MQTTHVKDSIALHPNRSKIMSNHMRASPSGKAVASQAAIREFESRRPLFQEEITAFLPVKPPNLLRKGGFYISTNQFTAKMVSSFVYTPGFTLSYLLRSNLSFAQE